MDLRFTADEIAFREEAREFFRDCLPADIRRKCVLGQRLSREDLVRWTHILDEKGWATPSWPQVWGGTGWSAIKQYIFKEELQMAPAPEPLTFNVNMIGPTLIAFGTQEQKQRFLPRIARLDYWFCQGFSEPGAGSDLASLRTEARLEGDDYVVNGQKIWTTGAHRADWCFLLVRTDKHAKKQQGITYLLMDMRTPGVTVRPIITIDGHHDLNEMFLEEVRIPLSNRVGEENKGWQYAKYLLSQERSSIARTGLSKMRVRRAQELAAQIIVGDHPLSEETRFRERVAALEVELKALEMLQMRVIAESGKIEAGRPDPRAPILKLKGSELQQATTELLLEVAGYEAMEYNPDFLSGGSAEPAGGEDWALTCAPNHYFARHISIAGGSSEIQRNIVASTLLGL